jgi:tetratricopeptide (TPR) repeat protein
MQKSIIVSIFCGVLFSNALAQSIPLPPSGENYQSSVSQWIGLVKVTVDYNSPNVTAPDGEDRTGKIWGGLVHYGYIDQGFGTSKAAPWRAGANENTTISFSHDVVIGSKSIKAGTYGLFLAVENDKPWTWILSSDSKSWGSYFYNPENDVVRVEAQPKDTEYTEYLNYTFENRERLSSEIFLSWENKKVGFKIEVPNSNENYLVAIRDTFRGTTTGFQQQPYLDAVDFCLQNNINLEEALIWADQAINDPYFGQENFASMSAKAQVLTALKREPEVETVMRKAINHPTADVGQIHLYARSLLAQGKTDKAMEVFKLNAKKNPQDAFTTNVGLARGYTAMNDKKNAIKHWEIAIKNLPENQQSNLAYYESELKKLK